MDLQFFVGVDVSKDSFSVCIKEANGKTIFQGSFTQSLDGFKAFLNTINKHAPQAPSVVGMESTSIYHINLLAFLIEKESLSEIKMLYRQKEKLKCIYLLFPELERNFNIFTKGMLNFLLKFPSAVSIKRAKREIVEYEFSQTFNGRGKKPSFSADDIIELANKSIGINSKAMEEILVSNIKRLLMIEDEIDKFDKFLSDGIKEVEVKEIDIISSIPGIGEGLAKSFVCELPRIDVFKNSKSLIAYVGIDPVIKQSGRYKAGFSISKKGNRHLRRIVFLMAINVIRFEGKFRDYFLRLVERGKSYIVAIIAVANKLLRTIYSMLIHGTFYSPNYS